MGETNEVAGRFGANLRRIRERANLSQEEVGLRSSLHRTEVGLLERGERTPRIDTLLKLAAGIGVRIECPLFDGISWTPGKVVARSGAFTFSAASGPESGSTPEDGEAQDV